MKIAGYIFCALGLLSTISMSHAASFQDKLDQQFLDSLAPDSSARMKKPFCNAFTGCGKKRSFYSENTLNGNEENIDKIRIPVTIYRALLRAASREIRDTLDNQSGAENAIPDAGIEYPTYLSPKIPRAARYES